MSLTEKQSEAFDKIKEKSDDDYEKNIVYIAAGTLVLSMTFLEKIIKVEVSTGVWFLILSWILLALTLLGNLVSHQLSSVFHETCRDLYEQCGKLSEDASEEDENDFKTKLDIAEKKFSWCNNTMRNLNWATTFSLFIGISLMVVFCSVNALNASKTVDNTNNQKNTIMSKQIKPQTQSTDISKGRTMSSSVKPGTQSVNTNTSSATQNNNTNSGSNQSSNK
ncbi:hypothetical protein [Pedobacter sp. UYP1]|uniref:hypothetical protein n=1 Tax=Pedobacter sp. UYP1 TaxID=1756396 RepID=UPI0033961967